MKKKINFKVSLRMRLTLITSLILTALCIIFTIFSIYNANSAISVTTTSGKLVDTVPSGGFYSKMEQIQPAAEVTEAEESLAATLVTNTVKFSELSLWFMAGVIIVGSGIMYFVSGIVLRPLRNFSKTVAEIDKDALSTRITDYNANDELSELSDSFNNMMTRLESAFRREQRFSAAAAHEMRTPLAVIKTNLDVLAMDETPSAQDMAESIEVVRRQTRRMTELVGSLMAFADTDEPENTELFDMADMVGEIIAESEPQMQEKNIEISVSGSSCTVNGNTLMLRQALSNLITNAVRYNVCGGKIDIIIEQKNNTCAVKVADTGIGIDESQMESIFEPFYRVDKSRSRLAGGAGLGLSIAADIVKKHGGSIVCEKNSPKGTIFTVNLPI